MARAMLLAVLLAGAAVALAADAAGPAPTGGAPGGGAPGGGGPGGPGGPLPKPGGVVLAKPVACPYGLTNVPGNELSERVPFYDGTVISYLKLKPDNDCSGPAGVGVRVDKAAFTSAPAPETLPAFGAPCCGVSCAYPDPRCAPPAAPVKVVIPASGVDVLVDGVPSLYHPFYRLSADYAPLGHPPGPAYGVEHWDMHFFLIDGALADAIVPGPCIELAEYAFADVFKPVTEACFPPGYLNLQAPAPFQGAHLATPAAPEVAAALSGGDGTKLWNTTWIYGASGGRMAFYEPMAKFSYLESLFDVPDGFEECFTIPSRPAKAPEPGFYPSQYCAGRDGEYVFLELRKYVYYGPGGCGGDDAPLSPASFVNAAQPLPRTLPPFCKAPTLPAPIVPQPEGPPGGGDAAPGGGDAAPGGNGTTSGEPAASGAAARALGAAAGALAAAAAAALA